jgi:hypothetical protein
VLFASLTTAQLNRTFPRPNSIVVRICGAS